MREERLLERIATAVDPGEKAGKSGQEIAVNSVVSHLNKILNTRQGSTPIADDFGVPNYHSMATRFSTESPESLDEIQASIVNAVKKWEPRLKSVRTRFLRKDDFDITLRLEIEAAMETEDGELPLTIKAIISPEGWIEVSA